jgi:hypothetical protein
MDRICIRRAFEEKAMEIGGKLTGAGSMMEPPFTMDFSFELDGKSYEITLTDLEEKKKVRETAPTE